MFCLCFHSLMDSAVLDSAMTMGTEIISLIPCFQFFCIHSFPLFVVLLFTVSVTCGQLLSEGTKWKIPEVYDPEFRIIPSTMIKSLCRLTLFTPGCELLFLFSVHTLYILPTLSNILGYHIHCPRYLVSQCSCLGHSGLIMPKVQEK